MRRREFIAVLGCAATVWPRIVHAQQAARPARVGILAFSQAPDSPLFVTFGEEMRKLGHVEGRTYTVEFRSARGDANRLRRLALELATLPVDVLVTDSGAASIAAKEATTVVPVIMAVVSDPVGIGLVASLARPGGNVTGFSILSPQLGTKRLALLKEVVPGAKTVGVLLNPASPVTSAQQLASIKDAARALDLDLVISEAQSPDSLPDAIEQLVARGISAVLVVADGMFFSHHKLIVDFVGAKQSPAIYPEREYAEAGGLIAYGPSVLDNFRRTASYVARILKGEKPGDLPVEQPVKFELMLNRKTAQALGLTFPPSLLATADEVIE